MKIFSAAKIREWDAFSIAEQGISSDLLMKRAAHACNQWIINHHFAQLPIHIFCGKGNNGGDGLALAMMLLENHADVSIYILESGKPGSRDFQLYLSRLHKRTTNIHFIQSEKFFPAMPPGQLIIDALFGSGLNRELSGIALSLVTYLNENGNNIISIDLPSGMFADKHTAPGLCITATHTLSFQSYKPAFLMPENEACVGNVHILNIGLSRSFEEREDPVFEFTDESLIKSFLRPRKKFSHKGNYGHAALYAGSLGMMGAAVLAARSCLRSGVGKLTCKVPAVGYAILQTLAPEALCSPVGNDYIEDIGDLGGVQALGIGPGIGTQKGTAAVLEKLLATNLPCVLDADALNIIAANPALLQAIPPHSVITPHPREFERLFGKSDNDFARLHLAMAKAEQYHIYIVLKGHYTAVITPMGRVYFNSSGNAGMAKAGTGDVLLGLITGLMCQQYPLPEAAIAAVYLHGKAGDIASFKFSQQAMQAGDLVDCIGEAWKSL